jgi:putative tricarboxylic transport membrane protein
MPTQLSRPPQPSARKSRRFRYVAGLGLAACLVLSGCGGNDPADYPTRAIEYVIPFAPGGSTDPVGREFSRELAEKLGTDANVQNMPGGDQAIGVSSVLSSKPDGHKIGLTSPSGIIVQPLLNKSLAYQGPQDYTPIAKMVTGPYGIFVSKDSPYKTFDDFLAAAKASPGKLRVGTTARMSDNAFTLYALEDQAGIKTTAVPFSGGAGEAILAVMGGKVDAAIATGSGQLGLVESGDLRPLAHTGTSEYDRFLPGSVSLESAGYDIPFASEFLTIAPAGLPAEVKDKLTGAAKEIVESPEWAKWCETQGILPDALTGKELDTWVQETTERSRKAIELAKSREG